MPCQNCLIRILSALIELLQRKFTSFKNIIPCRYNVYITISDVKKKCCWFIMSNKHRLKCNVWEISINSCYCDWSNNMENVMQSTWIIYGLYLHSRYLLMLAWSGLTDPDPGLDILLELEVLSWKYNQIFQDMVGHIL